VSIRYGYIPRVVTSLGVPHAASPRVISGPIRGHSYTLLQDFREVPEMGEGRVDYTKYKTPRRGAVGLRV
jgi:hypothetical protein